MLGFPARRGTAAGTVFLWILLSVAAAFAILAFIFSLLAFNREGFDESAILAAIATLQQCCDVVSAGVSSLLTSMSTVLTDLVTIINNQAIALAAIEEIDTVTNQTLGNCSQILDLECIPLFAADQTLAPGCYYFAQDIVCNVSICFLLEDNVEIDMRAQYLQLTDPTALAFGAYLGYSLYIHDGLIYLDEPSNASTSSAVDAYEYDGILLENLDIANFFRPIAVAYSIGLTVTGGTIYGANAVNTGGFGNRVISMDAVSGVTISGTTFYDNNVGGGDPLDHTQGVYMQAESGSPTGGLTIDNCHFFDTIVTLGIGAQPAVISGAKITNSDFTISDPLFPHQWIGMSGCGSGLRCDPPTAVTISDNRFSNRDAAPSFDGVYVESVDGMLMERNVLVENSNGFAPTRGTVTTAMIHVCAQNSAVDYGVALLGTCRGVTIRHNELLGAPFNASSGSATVRRAVTGILFEAGTDGALVDDNQLTGFGPGFLANGTYPACTSLNSLSTFGLLAGSAITNTGTSSVVGNVGIYPGSSISGFGTVTITNGALHTDDSVAIQAQSDLTNVYTCMQALACGTDLTGQDLGGKTLTAGVYCFSTSAGLTGTLTLNAAGNPNAVFIFQIGSTLTTASASAVNLINGGSDCNVFWQVGSSATLGTTTAFVGNIMAQASITLNTGATVRGRALARTGAVTMAANAINGTGCPQSVPLSLPAQKPAMIYVAAGAIKVHIRYNSLLDSACPTNFTTQFGGDGIHLAGAETRSSYAPLGYGPITFPRVEGCTAQNNQISNVDCGCAYVDESGDENSFYHNEAHSNEESYCLNVDTNGIVQCYGVAELSGWNLDADC